MLLEAFAQKTGDHVWRMDLDRILGAVAEGRKIQELIVFLESSAETAMPQPVVQFFADVQQRAVGRGLAG